MLSSRPARHHPVVDSLRLALFGASIIALLLGTPLAMAGESKKKLGDIQHSRGSGSVTVHKVRLQQGASYPLFAGWAIRTSGRAEAHFTIKTKHGAANCWTIPNYAPDQLILAPSPSVMIRFTTGVSSCSARSTPGQSMTFKQGSIATVKTLDPVFEFVVGKQRSVIKVRRGAVTIFGHGGPKQGVVVGRNQQAVVPVGKPPQKPTQIRLAPPERATLTKLEQGLPPNPDHTLPAIAGLTGPADPTPATTATFAFTASEKPVDFSCAVDDDDFRACQSPFTPPTLLPGRHTFKVQATDRAGNTGPPKEYSWTIERPASSPIAFESNRTGEFQIYVMNQDGSGQKQLTFGAGIPSDDPDWSPDGHRIAFHRTEADNTDIYVMNADGTHQVRLTTDVAVDRNPSWSPDGKKIAFESFRADGNRDIWVMNADGSHLTRLTTSAARDFDPDWSGDGTKIAFASERDGGKPQIYVMNADGSNQTRLTRTGATEYNPEWSPDGSRIAFHSDRTKNNEIYIMSADGSNPIQLTLNRAQDFNPTWSPDGTRIAFQSDRDGNTEIYTMNADGSNQTRLTVNPATDQVPDR
jgi:Tol biopolymer transport system component